MNSAMEGAVAAATAAGKKVGEALFGGGTPFHATHPYFGQVRPPSGGWSGILSKNSPAA
jgi:hypothetical protein